MEGELRSLQGAINRLSNDIRMFSNNVDRASNRLGGEAGYYSGTLRGGFQRMTDPLVQAHSQMFDPRYGHQTPTFWGDVAQSVGIGRPESLHPWEARQIARQNMGDRATGVAHSIARPVLGALDIGTTALSLGWAFGLVSGPVGAGAMGAGYAISYPQRQLRYAIEGREAAKFIEQESQFFVRGAHSTSATGTGFGRGQSRDIGRWIARYQDRDKIFDTTQDRMEAISIAAHGGYYDDTRTAEEFKEKTRTLIESTKRIMRDLRTSRDEAVQFMTEFSRMGVGDTIGFTRQVRHAAMASGASPQQIAQYSQQFEGVFRQYGFGHGFGAVMGAEYATLPARQMQSTAQSGMRTISSPLFLGSLYDITSGGREFAGEDVINRFLRGDISWLDMQTRGARTMSGMNYGERLEFLGEARERLDQIDPVLLRDIGRLMDIGRLEYVFRDSDETTRTQAIIQMLRRNYDMSQEEARDYYADDWAYAQEHGITRAMSERRHMRSRDIYRESLYNRRRFLGRQQDIISYEVGQTFRGIGQSIQDAFDTPHVEMNLFRAGLANLGFRGYYEDVDEIRRQSLTEDWGTLYHMMRDDPDTYRDVTQATGWGLRRTRMYEATRGQDVLGAIWGMGREYVMTNLEQYFLPTRHRQAEAELRTGRLQRMENFIERVRAGETFDPRVADDITGPIITGLGRQGDIQAKINYLTESVGHRFRHHMHVGETYKSEAIWGAISRHFAGEGLGVSEEELIRRLDEAGFFVTFGGITDVSGGAVREAFRGVATQLKDYNFERLHSIMGYAEAVDILTGDEYGSLSQYEMMKRLEKGLGSERASQVAAKLSAIKGVSEEERLGLINAIKEYEESEGFRYGGVSFREKGTASVEQSRAHLSDLKDRRIVQSLGTIETGLREIFDGRRPVYIKSMSSRQFARYLENIDENPATYTGVNN